jgi:hypothetical protein
MGDENYNCAQIIPAHFVHHSFVDSLSITLSLIGSFLVIHRFFKYCLSPSDSLSSIHAHWAKHTGLARLTRTLAHGARYQSWSASRLAGSY